MCWINLVAKVYAMGPELSRAPISLGLYFFVLKTFFFLVWFCFVFLLVDFFPPGADAGFTKRGGGRRSKHWHPGAGDPRYATGLQTSA